MFSRLDVSLISVAYLLLLFAIAYYGDKLSSQKSRRFTPLIVALCLPIFFTAWTFYGTSSQALEKGWYIPPTNLGAVLVIVFAIPLIKRLIRLGKQLHSTSIAGFLSSQYGNSKSVALLITTVAMVAMLPYLSLQLKAIAMSFDFFTTGLNEVTIRVHQTSVWQDSAFIATLLMIAFSIIFGTRHVDLTEHQDGLMLAIAFESIIKFISICAVGYYVGYQLFDGPLELLQQAFESSQIQQLLAVQQTEGYAAAMILGMAAIICLPRLFHVLVVESNNQNDASSCQWLFPLYTAALTFFILLIIIAGTLQLQGHAIHSEMYFLAIPLLQHQSALALLAYIGGLSAASSMIIVATITLSTMICNDMILPILFKRKNFYTQKSSLGSALLNIRRAVIACILLMAYGFYRLIGAYGDLGTIGLVSMSLIAQLAPAMIAALYWPKRHSYGAIAGILTGAAVWAYTFLSPALVQAGWLSAELLINGPFGIDWLRADQLFGLDQFSPLTHGVFWSLGLNSLVFILVSRHYNRHQQNDQISSDTQSWLTNASLLKLSARFLGEKQAQLALKQHYSEKGSHYRPNQIADPTTVQFIESLLAGMIGPSSAKHILNLTQQQQSPLDIDSDAETGKHTEALLKETSELLKFNRELLQASIDNMNQGITVIDNNQRLVAWNKRCIELFDFPASLFYIGSPMKDLVIHNSRQETLDAQTLEQLVDERMNYFSKGIACIDQRQLANGKVIEIRGEPIPGKGYVTTYTDITDYRQMVDALQSANENLEQRVKKRTQELTQTNTQLADAKVQAETANQSKTRFLAAASHDLAQPLNASRLFVTALQHIDLPQDPSELIDNLSESLNSAESLIKDLFDIAKIDAGTVKTSISHFSLSQLLDSLNKDFSVLAQDCGLDFHTHECSLKVNTDQQLLRRILQNILANALRYTRHGRVVLGCRRSHNKVKIEVWDTGIGIADDDIEDIFTEFKRLNKHDQSEGMGLGLATVNRLCLLLKLPIEVESRKGKGSVFRVTVSISDAIDDKTSTSDQQAISNPAESNTDQLYVLCIDNDPQILSGMRAMLSQWGHSVACCQNLAEARETISNAQLPSLILADYHLDDDQTGIDVVQQLYSDWDSVVPCIIISADPTASVKSHSKQAGFLFQQKPIKPNRLRAALSRFSAQERHNE